MFVTSGANPARVAAAVRCTRQPRHLRALSSPSLAPALGERSSRRSSDLVLVLSEAQAGGGGHHRCTSCVDSGDDLLGIRCPEGRSSAEVRTFGERRASSILTCLHRLGCTSTPPLSPRRLGVVQRGRLWRVGRDVCSVRRRESTDLREHVRKRSVRSKPPSSSVWLREPVAHAVVSARERSC